MEYKLKIERLGKHAKLNGKENVVFSVYWSLSATNGKTSVSTFGIQQISTDDLENFLPYDSLTEETVIDWIRNNLNLTELKLALDLEISNTEQKKAESFLPWL